MRRSAAGLLVVLFLACTPSAEEPSARSAEVPLWVRSTAEPYPFTTPVPPLKATPIDGIYSRTVPLKIAGSSVKCRRCAPYRLEIGRTRLELAKGRYFIAHRAPGKPDSSQFRSRGHYSLMGDEIVLFNDANCPSTRGRYRWTLAGDRLTLETMEDPCPFSLLRSRFLTATSWDILG
ncbi:MAG: hypothetical protein ACRDI3_06830 [Actinomycetota bacterium]